MEKIKTFIASEQGKDVLIVVIIILVGLGSFGLGRLSKQDTLNDIKDVGYLTGPANGLIGLQNGSNMVKEVKGESRSGQTKTNQSGNFFASKKGHKYYPVDCSAGKTIKESNKVWFQTKTEAESAGYTLSSSC